MNYFDSPKNQALWDKELASLKGERDRRKVDGYKPHKEAEPEKAAVNPNRRRITLAELEEIERRESGRSAEGKSAKPRRERNMQMQAPVLEDPSYGAMNPGD
ncbi:MAG: hypothetical protein K5696_12945 [Lachnospiraceae bacterium]|nr:hypothetical protein [Lachnospiraceae bacterium]